MTNKFLTPKNHCANIERQHNPVFSIIKFEITYNDFKTYIHTEYMKHNELDIELIGNIYKEWRGFK